jgi:AcrR family transcriptional regulator
VTKRPDLLAGEDLPPAPQQKRSREKTERLKAAALVLFGEKGYERTSIEEITERANVAVGGFYLHYRSKRQLLLVLMDELLEGLSRLDLRPDLSGDLKAMLRDILARGFARDLRYLGACRAWEEAVLTDADLAGKNEKIRSWTTQRVASLFTFLQKLPRARPGVNIATLAKAIDSFFWSLLAQAVRMKRVQLEESLDSATHLIYHALFTD